MFFQSAASGCKSKDVAPNKLNAIAFFIDPKQTHMRPLALCFQHLMHITSLIIMHYVLQPFSSLDRPDHNAPLNTLECTHQEASPNPAGVLSRHQIWRRTFSEIHCHKSDDFWKEKGKRESPLLESLVNVCVCLKGWGWGGRMMLDIIQPVTEEEGEPASFTERHMLPPFTRRHELQQSNLLPASQRRIIFPLAAQCRRLHGEHVSLHWIC